MNSDQYHNASDELHMADVSSSASKGKAAGTNELASTKRRNHGDEDRYVKASELENRVTTDDFQDILASFSQ